MSDRRAFLSQQRDLNKCKICHSKPTVVGSYHLGQNNNTVVTVCGKIWILCQLCELYTHFECYVARHKLSSSDSERDLNQFKESNFICADCRIFKDG